MASDYIIIPCTCDKFGLQGMVDFYDTVKNAQEENEKLKILGLLIIKFVIACHISFHYKSSNNLSKSERKV